MAQKSTAAGNRKTIMTLEDGSHRWLTQQEVMEFGGGRRYTKKELQNEADTLRAMALVGGLDLDVLRDFEKQPNLHEIEAICPKERKRTIMKLWKMGLLQYKSQEWRGGKQVCLLYASYFLPTTHGRAVFRRLGRPTAATTSD